VDDLVLAIRQDTYDIAAHGIPLVGEHWLKHRDHYGTGKKLLGMTVRGTTN
jgi:hypothetical protein